MEGPRPNPQAVRFGVFELDLKAGELRRNGFKVKLQEQPFQILRLLLERPGELVTHDEIIQTLWPNGTIVEYEHSVKTAVKKLRQALGDDADAPRYVETLPRRGYRFTYPVNGAGAGVVPGQQGHPQEPALNAVKGFPLHRWRFGVGAAALVTAGILAFLFRPALPPPRVTGSTQVTKDGREKEFMVTDGSRIYFSSFSGYNYLLYEVSTAGGEAVPFPTSVPNVPETMLTDISPDRSELLVLGCTFAVQEYCPLWVLPVLGGSPRRLSTLRAAYYPGEAAWSPDGREVAYVQGNSLYRARADGTESRKIVSLATGENPYWPRWSPDGSRLRFSVTPELQPTMNTQNNRMSLWEVSTDGKNLHPLLSGWNNPPAECCGTWTDDGEYFLFQSRRNGTTNIWAIREEPSFLRKVTHQPVQLTTGPTSSYAPLPSTDRKKLFVVTAQVRGELVRYDSASREFTPYLSGMSAIGVNLSRDKRWVTYVAYPEGTLWRSKVDGSERLQLTLPPLYVILPRWSPDGSRIAFMAEQPGGPWSVYVISAEGGSLEQPVPGDHRGADPNWLPDGNSLLFGGQGETLGQQTLDLEIVELRTHIVSRVPGSQGLWSPRWSRDGRHILAFPRVGNGWMLFDIGNQKWTELPKANVGWAEWSWEGDYIYFDGVGTGDQNGLFRMRISDQKTEQVASLKDFRQPTGWGSWVGLAPDDSPILLRDTGTQDIYALDWEAP